VTEREGGEKVREREGEREGTGGVGGAGGGEGKTDKVILCV